MRNNINPTRQRLINNLVLSPITHFLREFGAKDGENHGTKLKIHVITICKYKKVTIILGTCPRSFIIDTL